MYIKLPFLYALWIFKKKSKVPNLTEQERADEREKEQLQKEIDELRQQIANYKTQLKELQDNLGPKTDHKNIIWRHICTRDILEERFDKLDKIKGNIKSYKAYKQAKLEETIRKRQWFFYCTFGILAFYSAYNFITTIFRFNNLKDVKKQNKEINQQPISQ